MPGAIAELPNRFRFPTNQKIIFSRSASCWFRSCHRATNSESWRFRSCAANSLNLLSLAFETFRARVSHQQAEKSREPCASGFGARRCIRFAASPSHLVRTPWNVSNRENRMREGYRWLSNIDLSLLRCLFHVASRCLNSPGTGAGSA
jgi:hypothetical protein